MFTRQLTGLRTQKNRSETRSDRGRIKIVKKPIFALFHVPSENYLLKKSEKLKLLKEGRDGEKYSRPSTFKAHPYRSQIDSSDRRRRK
jgi:hypothetical protein